MFRTPKVGTRALAGVATIATITGVSLPLMATAASAAVNSITINNSSSSQVAVSSPITINADVTITAGDTTPIRYAVVSGPDADRGGNGTLVSDGDCAVTPATTTTETAQCQFTGNATAGTDVIRVFADTNGNQVIDSGEPSADATVVKYGDPAAISISPASDTAAAGTCNAYTVTLTDSGGRAVPGKVVNLEATLTGTTGTRDLAFCDPGTTNPTSSDAGLGSTTGSGTATGATTATDSNGKATFGIISNEPGGAQVRAYYDANGSTHFEAGEPTTTATKTFTAGGTGNSAQDAVSSLTVDPASQTVFAGDSVTYTLTAKNSSGDTTPNVVVSYTVTGANPASGNLTATNNAGQATFTYTATNAGTDNITFFVNQTTGGTAGADSSEPKATATTTVQAQLSGYSLSVTCVGTVANSSSQDCVEPLTNKTEVVKAFVSKGTLSNGDPAPAAGIDVTFSAFNHSNPGLTTTVTAHAVTDANGIATYNFSDPAAVDGTLDHVSATITGQTSASDYIHVTFEKAVPTTLTLTPDLATTQTGTSSTFTATVTDQFQVPVAGVNVDFSIAGRNTGVNGPTTLNKTTNSSGQATLTYTDTGATSTPGSDAITAWADLNGDDMLTAGEPSDTATNNFITEPATAGSVDLDVTGGATCGATADPANDSQSYDPSTMQHKVCAVVKTAGGTLLAGKTVTFTLSGVGSFATSNTDNTAVASPQTATTDASGVAVVYVRSTTSGSQGITASIDGKSDSGTITYNAAAVGAARNIVLKPEPGDITAGQNTELTALVTDLYGNPVQGVTVNFNEVGAGSFSNGTSSASGITGSTGTVTVTLVSAADATGTESVTATIASTGTDCGSAATPATSTDPAYTAGNCSDTNDYTFKAPAPADEVPQLTIDRTAMNVGQTAILTIKGTPGDTVQFFQRVQPASTFTLFRTFTFNSNGIVTINSFPRTNTAYFARTAAGDSDIVTLSVRPAVSLRGSAANRLASFNGVIVPGHGGVKVRIYAVSAGRLVALVATATTDSQGHYTATHQFAGHGRVQFIAQTISDNIALAGQSNRLTLDI